MRYSTTAASLLLGLCCMAAGSHVQAQVPEGAPEFTPGPRDGKQFGNWTLRCQLLEGQSEICEMFQQQSDKATERVVLHTAVGRLPAREQYGLLVVMPLGISLPPGVFMQVDEEQPKQVPVERCDRQGCRVEILLDDELLPKLKAGSKLVAIFHAYDDEGKRERVGVPISLKGFTAALDELGK